jgi:DNA ligase-associated metallophosphoesterase
MTGHSFDLGDARLTALPSGALLWPAAGLLCVGDLHLGKSARMARRAGALLPPYETDETLARLDADLAAHAPRRVICLGDSFDDARAETDLAEAHRLWLLRLMAGRDWVWIAGNHDPGPLSLPGRHLAEWQAEGIAFRHAALPGATGPEVSAHYHPKARVAGRARPAFLIDAARVILPAYGAFTGGLWCDDAAFAPLMGPTAIAVLTGMPTLALPRATPAGRWR